jgi:hypothetical protein
LLPPYLQTFPLPLGLSAISRPYRYLQILPLPPGLPLRPNFLAASRLWRYYYPTYLQANV